MLRCTLPWLLGLVLLVCLGACGGDESSSPATASGGGCGGDGCGGSHAGGSDGGVGGVGGHAVGGSGGGGGGSWTGVPTDRPLRLLFVGNSFTHQGPIPHLVRDLASSVGWPTPDVEYSAPGGVSLQDHQGNSTTLALVDAGSWDFVVLQDYSTRPTDNAGDPAAFKTDATWFYDLIKQASPEAGVVLYETWARHPDHSIYPGTFTDPTQMQAQLRFHYNDAADSYIPAYATTQPSTDVSVAPVGDAWEYHLGQPNPLRLHGGDDYHAGENGQYLNALVLYSTLYGVVASGASQLGLDMQDAQALQAAADATTGITQTPPVFEQPALAVGQTIRIDFGSIATTATGWNVLADCSSGSAFELVDSAGAATGVDVLVSDPFAGANEMGLAGNSLGYPAEVSQDVCWTGSFDGHAAALAEPAAVMLQDVDQGLYDLSLFASRSGDDGGLGRLTRFTVGGQHVDVEISDNTGDTASLTGVAPDGGGNLVVDIAVSPAASGRFAYLGALVLTKTSD